MVRVYCSCGQLLETEESHLNSDFVCPKCQKHHRFASAEAIGPGAGDADFDASLALSGPSGQKHFSLGGCAEISIGKLPDNAIVLPGTKVSRHHAKLVRVDFGPSKWKVVDCNSSNGLFVNGQRVPEKELDPGDVVQVGEFSLGFAYNPAAPAPQATKPPKRAVNKDLPTYIPTRKKRLDADIPPHNPVSPLRQYAPWLFLVALVPLIIHAFAKPVDYMKEIDILRQSPQFQERYGAASDENILMDFVTAPDEFLNNTPNHKFPSAFLAYNSIAHWFMAFLSAILFVGLLFLCFNAAKRYAVGFLLRGLFTGTFGILLLLGFQYAAMTSAKFAFVGFGFTSLILWAVKIIGISYLCATNPDIGFIGSFFGFVVGVGFCEEYCKVLPVVIKINSANFPSWRYCLLIGLASGIGFGVFEGIHYSSSYYNGMEPFSVYLVRFISCVALHAIWAGASSLLLHRNGGSVAASDSAWESIFTTALFCAPSIVLHGLYNTFLKLDYPILALIPALLSFGYFYWALTTSQKSQEDVENENPNPVAAA